MKRPGQSLDGQHSRRDQRHNSDAGGQWRFAVHPHGRIACDLWAYAPEHVSSGPVPVA
jgi:hypothetical protein